MRTSARRRTAGRTGPLVALVVLSVLLPGGSAFVGALAAGPAAPTASATPTKVLAGPASPPPTAAAGSASVATPRVSSYTVTFTETGLPSGIDWSVNIYLPGGSYDVTGSNNPTATIDLGNGTYTYTVPPLTTYLARDPAGNFTVRGSSLSVSVSFYPPTLYPVTFSGVGYPNGTRWSIAITWNDVAASRQTFTDSGPNLTLSLRNDSYSFTVDGPGSYGVDPSAGSFYVTGAAVDIPLTFHVGRYGIAFTETGLPAGTNWSVTVNGSTNSSTTATIVCHLGNGTYDFAVGPIPGYWILPASGILLIRGSVVDQLVVFTVATFPVTFTETGLPLGTLWTVNFSGEARASANATVAFAAANGSHPYVISGVAGYELASYRGNLSVAGTANGTVVAWNRTVYPVEFEQFGGPAGTPWSVEVNGSSEVGTGSSIGFSEANGTFAYRVTPPAGYAAFPVNGTVVVDGPGTVTWINFTLVPSRNAGLLGGAAGAYVVLGIVGAVAAVALVAVVLRRRRPPPNGSG